MKLTKRIVSLVLCAMMLVTLLPAGVFAADTAAMSETSNAIHNYLDFEGLTTSSTADDIKAYIGEATPNFVGTKTGATFTAGGFTVKEESGNQFVNVGASKSFGIYDEGDFLKDSKFELSFRVRINSATPTDTNPVSVARLHYTEDTDSNGRTDFFDMLAITKWDSENGTGVFASSVSSTTATGCGKQVKVGEWYKVCYRIDLVSGDMALYVDDVLLTSTKVTVIHAGIAVDGICFARDYSKIDADLDDIHVRILNDNEAVAAPMPPVIDCTATTITDANGSKMS